MKPEPRFIHPAKANRPRGARMIEMYSLKLGRRVTAHSYPQFEALLESEVDSAVSCYCERPTEEGLATDLWQRRGVEESFVILTEGECTASWMDIPVRRIAAAELASRRLWLRNWQCMLPVVIANYDAAIGALRNDVRRLVRETMALAIIEKELVTGDPAPLRGCVFRLLLEGELKAPSLHVEALSLSTRIGPAS
jgi:hypothetical protein